MVCSGVWPSFNPSSSRSRKNRARSCRRRGRLTRKLAIQLRSASGASHNTSQINSHNRKAIMVQGPPIQGSPSWSIIEVSALNKGRNCPMIIIRNTSIDTGSVT